MKNQVPLEVRKDIIKKITNSINSKQEEKYVVLFVSHDSNGLSIKFLSTYNDNETIGLLEKAKLYAYEKMSLDELTRTRNTNLIETEIKEKKSYVKPNYVS